jgi:hypothetical protein
MDLKCSCGWKMPMIIVQLHHVNLCEHSRTLVVIQCPQCDKTFEMNPNVQIVQRSSKEKSTPHAN